MVNVCRLGRRATRACSGKRRWICWGRCTSATAQNRICSPTTSPCQPALGEPSFSFRRHPLNRTSIACPDIKEQTLCIKTYIARKKQRHKSQAAVSRSGVMSVARARRIGTTFGLDLRTAVTASGRCVLIRGDLDRDLLTNLSGGVGYTSWS